jgi:hypothetical protein
VHAFRNPKEVDGVYWEVKPIWGVLGQVVNQARKEANGEADAQPDPHDGSEPFTVERAVKALPDALYLTFRSRRHRRNQSAPMVFEPGSKIPRTSCQQLGRYQGAVGARWWGRFRGDARFGIVRFALLYSGALRWFSPRPIAHGTTVLPWRCGPSREILTKGKILPISVTNL